MTIVSTMSDAGLPLSPELRRWVELRVSRGLYSGAEEYIAELVQRDRDAMEADTRRVRALIEEGLASGTVDREPEDVLADIIAGIRDEDG